MYYIFIYRKMSFRPCAGFYLRKWKHTGYLAVRKNGDGIFYVLYFHVKTQCPAFDRTACNFISEVTYAAEFFILSLFNKLRRGGSKMVKKILFVFILGQMVIRFQIWTLVPVQWQINAICWLLIHIFLIPLYIQSWTYMCDQFFPESNSRTS